MGWKASIATIVFETTSAVNQLLLWISLKCSILNHVKGLKTSSGRKSPAWAAVALIFDWTDTVVVSPVPFSGSIFESHRWAGLGCAASLVTFEVVVISRLLSSHGSVFVDASFEWLSAISIVVDNASHILTEDVVSLSGVWMQTNKWLLFGFEGVKEVLDWLLCKGCLASKNVVKVVINVSRYSCSKEWRCEKTRECLKHLKLIT